MKASAYVLNAGQSRSRDNRMCVFTRGLEDETLISCGRWHLITPLAEHSTHTFSQTEAVVKMGLVHIFSL